MRTRIVSAIMITLLLVGMLTLAFKIQLIKASGTIYIRADGSIEGTDTITTTDKITYTFTDNIYDSIVVERNNIVIDGNRYTLQGTGAYLSKGIDLSGRTNVTVHGTQIQNFWDGIRLDSSSHNSISGNNITNNWLGIRLGYSSNNIIYHNNFVDNIQQVYIQTPGYANFWDDGYPSGGNYWSDYTGVDLKNGPNQDLPGGDGIGDTPYTIDADNIDHYPLIHAWNSTFSEQQVVALVNGSRAYNYDLELENIAYSHYAFRAGGSLGANETANWIKSQFESFGLEAWLEPFEFTTWDLLSKPSLLTDDDGDQGTTNDQITIPTFQCEHWSWPTPESGIFADLVVLPLPDAANIDELSTKPINMTEWNAIDTTGKILLIGREVSWCLGGPSTFVNKITAQPPAAIVRTWWFDWMSFVPDFFNSAGGRPLSGYGPYFWDLQIPVGFVNYEDGLTIRNRENAMDVSANVSVTAVISTGTHYNVVGKIRGYQNPEKVIIISSHYDTVMCSGFCDNGAGTAGVIELAKVFGDLVKTGIYKPRYTLLFVLFTSEELYLVGSINYVKQHKSEMPDIAAVINLDCIGSDDLYVTETDPVNGFDLDQIILNAAQDLGIPAYLEPAGASDQETFRDPSWANDIYYFYWGLDAGIYDATPVESSALIISYPLLYSDLWGMGTPGWIHTSYDNSSSTETLNWVEAEDLGNHIKVAALTIVRISPDTWHIAKAGDLGSGLPPRFFAFDGKVNGYDLALFVQCYKGLAPPEAMYLGDLGGPINNVPTFFKCDGKVDGYDLALFIQCYKGLGPDP